MDGERVFLGTVGGEAEAGQTGAITARSDATDARLRVRVPVKAGPRLVAAAFIRKIGESTNRLRPFLRSNAGTYDSTGRPHVKSLTVAGPFNPTGPGDTPSRRARLHLPSARPPPARGDPARRRILADAGARARLPAPGRAIGDLAPLLRSTATAARRARFDTGIQLALRRLLASPTFVFRVEDDPAARRRPARRYRVSDLELASRLSFFLWSSMPDDDAARPGGSRDGCASRPCSRRRCGACWPTRAPTRWCENFAGQWLHVRNLQNIAPNTDEFPDFDNDLRDAFRRETELFFGSVMREDRNVLDLLTADYTFVNERLAKHYGMPDVYGSQFRRVTLDRRRAARACSARAASCWRPRTPTAPRRCCAASGFSRTCSARRRRRRRPTCRRSSRRAGADAEDDAGADGRCIARTRPAPSCHRLMDPLGFALENFDAVGAWRTREAGAPVDAQRRAARRHAGERRGRAARRRC